VSDLTIHPRENDLVLATYGRALWTGDITPLQELSAAVLDKPAYLFDIEPRARYGFSDQGMNYNLFGDKYLEVPNEPDALIVNYYISGNNPPTSVRIIATRADTDEVMRDQQGPARIGLNRVVISMAASGGGRGRGVGAPNQTGPGRGGTATGGALTVGKYNVSVWFPLAAENSLILTKPARVRDRIR
jgi:hypothetical protein